MHRFYCTVCKKVRRTRRLPHGNFNTQDKPQDRVARCAWHGTSGSRRVATGRGSDPKIQPQGAFSKKSPRSSAA